MSNLSFVRHVGDGINRQFTLSTAGANIGYFRTEDIHAYVNGVEVTFTINAASPHIVVLDAAPALGADVLLRREMPVTTPYANFERGNNFGHRQVNNSFIQQLYLTQEMLDGFTPEGFYLKQHLNAGNKRVENLGEPVLKSDAATKEITDNLDDRVTAVESSATGDTRYVHWLYNSGEALGGERVITLPYTFTSIATLFINGVRMTYGKAFDFDTVARTIELAEELEEGDEVVVAIGTEPAITPELDVTNYTATALGSATQRPLGSRFADILSVKDFGALGDGVTDDTLAFVAANESGANIFVPYTQKGYVVNQDFSVCGMGAIKFIGSGTISYVDICAPVQESENHLWQGGFQVWQRGSGFVDRPWRVQVCDGFSMQRLDGSEKSITLSNSTNGCRVTRTSGDTSSSALSLTATLSRKETATIKGSNILALKCKKAANYTGSTIKVEVNTSDEIEQCITRADGKYTNGNKTILSWDITPTELFNGYSTVVDVPEGLEQLSVNILISFSGTASGGLGSEAGDWVELGELSLSRTSDVRSKSFSEALSIAKGRFQSSLPYGSVAAKTTAGSYKMTAVDRGSRGTYREMAQHSVSFDMILPPTVFLLSTTGSDMELYNEDTSTDVAGLIRDISTKGATFLNNAGSPSLEIGDSLAFHYIAEVRL